MSTVQVELQDTNRRKIRLLKPLGKGGFGAVYLADVYSPEGLVQRMAVKLLHEEFARDNQLAARARDEARLMSQLNHDHVVKVHALTQVGERAAVLMEYVEGVDGAALLDAADRAKERGLPPRVCAAIIEHSASALHAAWTTLSPQTGQPLRVVHRDIKPSNLLLSSGGVVKVMDFGVARAEFEREAQTQSVQFGTQRYMAPERWLHGEAGPESDIYSLGITLWELLTGGRFERLPLQETSYNKRRAEHVEQLRGLQGGEALVEIVEGMLAFSPEVRLNAQQVEERLGALADNLPGPELRRYARKVVPPLVESRLAALANDPDLREISGTLQTRGAPSVTPPAKAEGPVAPPEALKARRAPVTPSAHDDEVPSWLPVVVGSGAVLAAGLVAVLVWWFFLRPAPGPAPDVEPVAPVVEPAAVEVPVVVEPDVVEPDIAPAPTPSRTKTAPKPEPTTQPAPAPSPAPSPAPVAATISYSLLSDPAGLTATVGGKSVTTPSRVELKPGEYTVRFSQGGEAVFDCPVKVDENNTRVKLDSRREPFKCR